MGPGIACVLQLAMPAQGGMGGSLSARPQFAVAKPASITYVFTEAFRRHPLEAKTPNPSKKAYKSPQLKVYGDIRTLTNAVANNTKVGDGGMGGTNKTN